MSRDDETEPMTRLLGVIAHSPREQDPPKRLVDAEKTRLEIARPQLSSTEPATRIVHPSLLRPPISLDTMTLPATPRPPDLATGSFATDPHEAVTVRRPARDVYDAVTTPHPKPGSPFDDLTAPRPPVRRMTPFVLAALLIATCLATGLSLVRPQPRTAKAAAAPTREQRPASPAPAPAVTPIAAAAVPSPPDPAAPVDAAVIAELEKRAVDRLRDNDHPGALALYRELISAEADNRAYPVMVALLEKKVSACQGDPRCAR